MSSCDLDCDDNDALTIGDDDNDGYLSCIDDCDDTDGLSFPGASETCEDGVDQDCDGFDQSCILSVGDACSNDIDCDTGYCGPATGTCATLSSITISALDQEYTGNLGGISSADAMCASQASSYGFSGGWVIIIIYSGCSRSVPVFYWLMGLSLGLVGK